MTMKLQTTRLRELGWRAMFAVAAIAGCLGSAPGAEPAAPSPNSTNDVAAAQAPSRHEYTHFAVVNDRNIFNPNRTKRSRYNPGEEKPPEPKIEVVALTGTLSYEQGTLAFFDSATGEFRKATRVGEQIAGYTVKEIAAAGVGLERGGETLQLKVGQQLRRQDEGPWEVTTGQFVAGNNQGDSSRSGRRSSRNESAGESGAAGSSASASGEGPSEALKRLLEQRRKEQSP